MKKYRLTLTIDVLAEDDPSAREKLLPYMGSVDTALFSLPYGYKLRELLEKAPPRNIPFLIPENPEPPTRGKCYICERVSVLLICGFCRSGDPD